MRAIGLPGAELAEMQARHESVRVNAARLLDAARVALEGAADATASPSSRQEWLDFEVLYERWRKAEEAAVTAELTILEMELRRECVPAAQRQRAAELRDAAHACRAAVFAAGRL